MPKCLVALVLCLFAVKNVLSLHCYSTDLKIFQRSNLKYLHHFLTSCEDYVEKIGKLGEGFNRNFGSENLVCFSVNVELDIVDNIVITGCLPEGGCDLMKNVFANVILRGGVTADVIKAVGCSECNTDGCNSVAGPVTFAGAATAAAALKMCVGIVLAEIAFLL